MDPQTLRRRAPQKNSKKFSNEVATRRAKNKQARKSRKKNRN